MHLVVDEAVPPEQQPTRDEQDDCEDEPADDGQRVEGLAAHCESLLVSEPGPVGPGRTVT